MINPNNYSKIMYNGTSLGKIIINGNVWWEKEQNYKLMLNPSSLSYNLESESWDEDYQFTYSVSTGYWNIYAERSNVFSIHFDDMDETFSVSIKNSMALYDGYQETIKVIAELDSDYEERAEAYLNISVYGERINPEEVNLEMRNITEEIESDFADGFNYKVTVYFDIYDALSEDFIESGYNTFEFTDEDDQQHQTVDLSWTTEINGNYYDVTGSHTFYLE